MTIRRILSIYGQKLWRRSEKPQTKRLFLVLSVVAILLIGVPVLADMIGHISYRGGDYAMTQKIWRFDALVSWYERDVAPTNAGLSYYKAGQLTPAVDQLERALKRGSPKRDCRIRWNLASVLGARAAERTQSQPNDAIGDYARAINVLNETSCKNNPQYTENFQRLSDDLNNKMQALIKQISDEHKRPADDEKKDTKQTSDQERTKQQNQNQVEYQNSINNDRYDQQTDEEKDKSYKEKAW